uniref:Uncharacterized protein n=1 Tax=Oryza glumipatula TaxID=40148 RepID=A0A0D9YTW6_9ORYZ
MPPFWAESENAIFTAILCKQIDLASEPWSKISSGYDDDGGRRQEECRWKRGTREMEGEGAKLVILTDVAAGDSGVAGRSCGRGGHAGAVGKAVAGDEVQGRPAVGKVLRRERQGRPVMGISRGRRSGWGSHGKGGGEERRHPRRWPCRGARDWDGAPPPSRVEGERIREEEGQKDKFT